MIKLLMMSQEASMIILDELTAGLDQETARQVYTFLKDEARKKDKIILFVDHNLADEMDFTKSILLENGKRAVS